MEILLAVVGVLVLLSLYAAWTASRLDRLHARVDAARSLLDARLVRRAVAALTLAESLSASPAARRLEDGARAALAAADADAAARASGGASREADDDARAQVENDLIKALRAVPLAPGDPALDEVRSTTDLLALARQVYDDAVRDTRALRLRRLPRALRLAGHRPMPHYFDVAEFDVTELSAVDPTEVDHPDDGDQPGAAVR